MADQRFATPVYWSWPERPYLVMGSIGLANPQKKWKRGDTAESARLARSKGGDALIVLEGDETGVGQNAVPAMKPFPTGSTSALVIRWKSSSEVDEESHRVDGLRAYLKRSYPALGLGSKNDLWEMSVEYVAWLGLDINSQPGAGKVEEVLSSLITASPDTSKRLFKGTLRAKATSTRPTETIVYGIATVTRTGDDVTIVSDPGKISFKFHGLTGDGQLRGQFNFSSGATAFTGKAEGVMSPGKILLKSDGLAAGKPIEGIFTFLQ
ncbi:MAG: hypothetical protein JWQ71_1265 [Pedosphaera sp.]|nr:hypothetical protein [Pedosphaera sp.]